MPHAMTDVYAVDETISEARMPAPSPAVSAGPSQQEASNATSHRPATAKDPRPKRSQQQS